MNIKLNGEDMDISHPTTVMDLFAIKGVDPDAIIVELNYEILKKEIWSSVMLNENDTIEVLRFVGGG